MWIITIPGKPESVNHIYRSGKNASGQTRRFLSAAGKQFKKRVAVFCLATCGRMQLTEPVLVEIRYYFPDNRRRDVTNYDKAILDAMSGLVWEDDDQIVAASFHKYVSPKAPRTEIRIFTMEEIHEAYQSFVLAVRRHTDHKRLHITDESGRKPACRKRTQIPETDSPGRDMVESGSAS